MDLYRGQLLPTRVGGALEHRQGGLCRAGAARAGDLHRCCRLPAQASTAPCSPKLAPFHSTCPPAVRHVAAGSHLTVAVTTGGRVYQMGVTGASVPAKHCFWEGATMPELVRGALQGESACL